MVIHDELGTPLAGEIRPDPLQEDGQTKTRSGQKLQVYGRPREPRAEAAHMDLAALEDGKALPNDSHASFVEVMKRARRRFADDAVVNQLSCVTALLHRHLSNAGERLPVFLE